MNSSIASKSPLAASLAESIQTMQLVQGPEWLQSVRSDAASAFLLNGLPGNKDEAWKYTSLRSLENLSPEIGQSHNSDISEDYVPLLPASQCWGFRFQNGKSQWLPHDVPGGVKLITLKQALTGQDSDLQARLRVLLESVDVSGRGNAFQALNTALVENGVIIHVSEGIDAGTCLAQWDQGQSTTARMDNFRVIVLLEKGSRLSLHEEFRCPADGTPSSQPLIEGAKGQALNLVYQTELAADSQLQQLRIQAGSADQVLFTFHEVRQGQDSSYIYTGFDIGGGLVRHDISCRLDGPAAHAALNGAFVLDEDRHVDLHLCIDHRAIDCTSEQFFRGVLGGRSRGVFNGKAIIQPGADGSKVRQSNANLLLSEFAEIDTKPELEIYADEVEASHGATVGQLDETAVFYLRSRGLTERAARRMLTAAFCRAVTAELGDTALAEHVANLLDASMPDLDSATQGV
jgi:Fe-S cluster assembly protein SufD